jgi:subtilisin family serine protease
MRHLAFSLAVLASVAIGSAVPAVAGEPARELVVQLSAPALSSRGLRAVQPGALPAAVRSRFASLGLHATRALGTRSAAPASVLPEVFAFHPERILLVDAADPELAHAALIALANDALVDWAEPNVVRSFELMGYGERAFDGSPRSTPFGRGVQPFATTELDTLANDPYLRNGRQYGLWNLGPRGFFGGVLRADVHAIEAWTTCVGGNDIKLAVADTGIDPAQPELGGLMPDGSPRIVDALNATDDPDGSVLDSYGHGTPVTGVMAARTNNGAPFTSGAGVAGVCGGDGGANAGCRIVPIKITPGHSGEATSFDIARALLHAADVGARAINLSFAGDAPSRLERLALTYALYKGCIPVAAAGNSGFDDPTLPLYPACYARDGLAISVGASDSFDQRTPFSSYPFGLDLVAPGVNVYTTFMTYPSYFGASYPGYVPAAGTSFSAPFVTGAVGLLAAARPELTDNDFQHVIRESADDIGAPGFDEPTAYGRLNLQRMLARVGPGVGIWHDEVPADSFAVEGEGVLTVGEAGPGTTGLHDGAHWSTRLAALATVAIPDSFLNVTGAWLRVAGTMAARGDFAMPYFSPSAEVLRRDNRSATFRGYLYRVNDDSCDVCDDIYVPLAPSNVRFAFTIIGTVDRPPVIALTTPPPGTVGEPGDLLLVGWDAYDPDQVTRVRVSFEPDGGGSIALGEAGPGAPGGGYVLPCLGPADMSGRLVATALDEHGFTDQARATIPFTLKGGACSAPLSTFRVTPSPFQGTLSVFAPGIGVLRVIDASGRLVRRLRASGGAVQWDGHDDSGASTPAGIYWVRYDGAAGTVTKRVVKLGR